MWAGGRVAEQGRDRTPDPNARFTCLGLLEKPKVLAQQGGEKQLSNPQVDSGHGEEEGAPSAACRQGAEVQGADSRRVRCRERWRDREGGDWGKETRGKGWREVRTRE